MSVHEGNYVFLVFCLFHLKLKLITIGRPVQLAHCTQCGHTSPVNSTADGLLACLPTGVISHNPAVNVLVGGLGSVCRGGVWIPGVQTNCAEDTDRCPELCRALRITPHPGLFVISQFLHC